MAADPRRGEVWLAILDKRRPVIVLTRDPMGRYLDSIIVAPVTSTIRGVSTEVPIGPEDGVRRPSVVSLDNVQLLDKGRLIQVVGKARRVTMASICRSLAIATGCEDLGFASTTEQGPT